MKLSVVLAAAISVVGTVAWDCNDSKSNHFIRIPSMQPGRALVRLTSRRDINKDKFSSNEATVKFCIAREDRPSEWDQYGPLAMNCDEGAEFTFDKGETGLTGPVTIRPGGACSKEKSSNLKDSWFHYDTWDALRRVGTEEFPMHAKSDHCGGRKAGITCAFDFFHED